MDKDRKDPALILEEIKNEEVEDTNGKLKIFFGYAAGVGKTYSMLEAAHDALKSGQTMVSFLPPGSLMRSAEAAARSSWKPADPRKR